MQINYLRKRRATYWPQFVHFAIMMMLIWLLVPTIFYVFHLDAQSARDGLTLGLNVNTDGRSDNWRNVLGLFEHNYGLAWFYIGVAFLPLPCYWVFAVFNALTVGIVLVGPRPIATLLLGILPHGVLEITAQILTLCIAAQITKYIQQLVHNLWHPTEYPSTIPWSTLLIDMCSIVPLLYITSAIIETFVTPVLMQDYF
ncbi:stage II sporulation protein M [Furfurilactobacillus rossiae]|uniref:Stage II sporulation protein M n=1 Tax=Furfurilactobacillus rossiae DSM 15814 TaxID=1114972 RepID=A0A0R1RLB0_9LACO|nr:stage II sporulation protein M [Furfurilactobacillus rossiae]KRL57297.1 hypothetical protein FD35_GL000308 [Furfurilactobacillus rossiae DSM 15814]QFR65828.1 hypothetical protein LR814_01345 [Furfurilactobacillus rossiae]QLE61235.1 hypothetical protein LROSRS0_1189 [Furfurilactobacillus rossiae]